MNGTFYRLEVGLRVVPEYSSRCLLFMPMVTAIYDVFNCSSKNYLIILILVLKYLKDFKEDLNRISNIVQPL